MENLGKSGYYVKVLTVLDDKVLYLVIILDYGCWFN